jgi:hypothetical protein
VKTPANQALLSFPAALVLDAFTPHSSRSLNCFSNLIGHDRANKSANGVGE